MAARANPQGLARMREVLQSHVGNRRIPGAVAIVAVGGQVVLNEALGVRDPSAGDAMPADAIFRIYSMTKPIVSLAALMLAEEGRLSLAEPVAKYLPMFAGQQVLVSEGGVERLEPPRRAATVHDLLRHTAGLTYEFLGSDTVQRRYREVDITDRARSNIEFCEVLASVPLAHHPGSCWQYSRATDVLGAVVEVAAGQPLGKVLKQRILGPLGMKDTAFCVPRDQWHRIAEPFAKCPDSGEAVVMIDPKEAARFESGGGGLMSSAHDYTRFLQLMRNRGSLEGMRLVSRKTIEWMTADHLGGIPAKGDLLPPGHGFGLGFAVRRETGLGPQPGSPGQYYWSGIGGTAFFVDPVEDVFAMLLTQAPNQRIVYRNLLRHLVYAALD